jgi:hypothetical protein
LHAKEGSLANQAGQSSFINAVFGYCAQELHGVICLQIMGIGVMPIIDLFVGDTRACGENFLNSDLGSVDIL